MYHPETMYEMAKLKIAEDLRQADRERLVRQAGAAGSARTIDTVPFRERVARLFGSGRPSRPAGVATAGA